MKKLLSILLVGLTVLFFSVQSPALADGDPASGAKVFAANCNACHLKGKNTVMPMKTLNKADLAKYLKGFGEDAQAAVAYQVTNGKNAMPKFKGRLSDQQIADVSAYVVSQAEKGW